MKYISILLQFIATVLYKVCTLEVNILEYILHYKS